MRLCGFRSPFQPWLYKYAGRPAGSFEGRGEERCHLCVF